MQRGRYLDHAVLAGALVLGTALLPLGAAGQTAGTTTGTTTAGTTTSTTTAGTTTGTTTAGTTTGTTTASTTTGTTTAGTTTATTTTGTTTAGTTTGATTGGTTTATSGLPDGWTSMDIGTTKPKTPDGTTVTGTGASAVWTVTCTNGTGDVWGATDPGFQFAYTTLSGDGGITARLLSQVGGKDTDWSKAGTMLRLDTTPGSPEAFLSYASATGGKDPQTFQPSWRANPNGKPVAPGSSNPTDSYGTDAVEPIAGTHRVEKGSIWMRTQRIGTTYQHLVSNDGSHWLLLGSETVNVDPSMPVLAGIWASQGGSKTPNVVTYDNVAVDNTLVQPVASTFLSAPGDLEAFPGTAAVLLTFDPVPGAMGYIIYRQTGAKGTAAALNTTPTPNAWYVDSTAASGTGYIYTVKSVSDLTAVGGGTAVSVAPAATTALVTPH